MKKFQQNKLIPITVHVNEHKVSYQKNLNLEDLLTEKEEIMLYHAL